MTICLGAGTPRPHFDCCGVVLSFGSTPAGVLGACRCWRVVSPAHNGRPATGLAVSRGLGDLQFKEPTRCACAACGMCRSFAACSNACLLPWPRCLISRQLQLRNSSGHEQAEPGVQHALCVCEAASPLGTCGDEHCGSLIASLGLAGSSKEAPSEPLSLHQPSAQSSHSSISSSTLGSNAWSPSRCTGLAHLPRPCHTGTVHLPALSHWAGLCPALLSKPNMPGPCHAAQNLLHQSGLGPGNLKLT